MTPDQIAAVVAALLAGNPDVTAFEKLIAGGADARYAVTIDACPRPLPAADIERQSVICGRINLPESYLRPEGRRIDLAFAVLKARSLSPAPDPVVYLHGGPGGTAVSDLAFNDGLFSALRERRDIVLFDQRASGISARTVTCYNTYAESLFDLAGVGDPAKRLGVMDVMKRCLGELEAEGVPLADYNTTANARDVRAVMHALGYPVYNAYGISYGTTLGQELLRTAPEGLRSIVLDSISPVDAKAYDTNGVPLDEAIGWVVDQCSADAACAAAYPNFERTLKETAAKLVASPLPAVAARPAIDLSTLIALFEDRNVKGKAAPNTTAYIPKIVTEWGNGVSTTYDALKASIGRPSSPAAVVAPYMATVNNDQLIMGYVALLQSEQLRQLDLATETLLQRLGVGRGQPSDLSDLDDLLDRTIDGAIRDMDVAALIQMSKDYARFVGRTPDRAEIEAWLKAHLPEPHLSRALALVSVMSASDVAGFYQRAGLDVGKYTKSAQGGVDLAIYACQEAFPFNTRDGLRAVADRYRFSFIKAATLDDTEPLYDMCDALFAPAPRPGFHDPVVSAIPTLALSGMNDTQTNPDAAEHVAASLTDAQHFLLPEAGHGTLIFSQCAVDIGVAFVEHPTEPVNAACIEKLRPTFILP